MISRRNCFKAAAGTAALAIAVVVPASAATASTAASSHSAVASASVSPDNSSECNPNPVAAVTECTTVTGSTNFIDTLSGFAFNNLPETLDSIHIELYGPGGEIKRCDPENIPGGGKSDVCLWSNPNPHIAVTSGNYCSRAIDSSGDYLSNECIDVKK